MEQSEVGLPAGSIFNGSSKGTLLTVANRFSPARFRISITPNTSGCRYCILLYHHPALSKIFSFSFVFSSQSSHLRRYSSRLSRILNASFSIVSALLSNEYAALWAICHWQVPCLRLGKAEGNRVARRVQRLTMTQPSKKRKDINDFFKPFSKRSTPEQDLLAPRRGLQINSEYAFTIKETPVPGLALLPNFIEPAEERSILSFLNDASKCTWRTDLSRRTMHFGGTYCLMPSKTNLPTKAKPEILQAPPMPKELEWLVQRMVEAHVFPDGQRPQYCIVNEYTDNLGISAHTENFQFGEPVVGLSLLSTCPIRFHELTEPFDGSVRSGKAGKAEKTGRKVDVNMPGRSLLVMRGESRWRWQHEIARSAKGRGAGWKRVSLTFRYRSEGSTL